MLLAGHRAVVTGASGNLGQAVVPALLAEGATVVAVASRPESYSSLAAAAAATPERCFAVQADVTQEGDVARLCQEATERLGAPPDILANLAGGFQFGTNLWELAPAQWRQMMALNLDSVFLCCRAFVPAMLERGWGRIVNISSRGAINLRAGSGAYAVSKAGVVTYTQALREELKGSGVAVCAIVPGTIDGPATRQSMPKADPAKWVLPADLARLVVYLCTEEGGLLSGGLLPAYGAG